MKTLRERILNVEAYPFNFNEIKRILQKRCPGMKMRFVFEGDHNFKGLFKNKVNVCFVLCEVGALHHWVVFTKKHFYDPIAMKESFWAETFPKLHAYIVKEKLEMNTFQHEKNKAKVNTCGLHCVIRAAHWNMTNKEFHQFLTSIMPGKSDFLVSLMCYLGSLSIV